MEVNKKNSFSTCWMWPLSTVTSFYLHVVRRYSCGEKKISHKDFRLTLIREMTAQSGHEPRPSMPVGRPASASNNTRILDTLHNKHWPGRSNTKRQCRVCSVGGGHEANGAIQMGQVWRGASCWSEVFWRLPYKDQLVRHLFVRPVVQTADALIVM